LVSAAIEVYRSYGYVPIDTPALELAEILTGGGGADAEKQMYRFEDAGGREVAMRFDLTVPLARFAAQHIDVLGTPFKRYHIAPVWRGENPQKGRYREFVQCDFDTIGTESAVADIETVLVVHDLFAAVGAGPFTIRVNDRRILNAVLADTGLADR
jgi:histidyl-tRNA synthetase